LQLLKRWTIFTLYLIFKAMKKSPYLLFLIAFLFLFSCSSKINDKGRSGLKGRVLSVKEIRCDPVRSNDKWVAGESLAQDFRILCFDKKGNLIKSYKVNMEGDTVTSTTSVHENGDMVREVFYSREEVSPTESIMIESNRIEYDRVSEEQVNWNIWKGDQQTGHGATYYDRMGRIVMQKQVRYNTEETLHYIYDKILLMEHYREDMSGNITVRQFFDYDDFDKHGNWKLMLIYPDADKIIPDFVISREIDYY